ncbi:DUF805 domain-containing protein [Pseudomonas neustonica]|uniref:DUF805 domain-containing protein n=1 Tax=Pseudomonas neustonica TaxID=2487346 RepID=A0ABX9XHZ6_9PSED|nr:DUF805 domain-containing protein [Pseudomonas sp. SSM44]ROZ84735.1 DUF805 domain-containing protein [Pseudomonas neustonica]
MVSYWQTLGVELGSDQRTIKRAYSRLLKEVHPEDHPEDFMALREAYEQALASAPKTAPRRMADADVSAPEPNWQRQPVPPPESVSPPDQPAAPEPVMSPEALAKKAAEQQAARQALADERERIQELHRQREQAVREEGARAQQRLDQLGNDFTQLVNDPQRRADAAAWDALLLAPDLNNLEVRLVVGRELLSALLDNLGDQERAAVPAAILVRLDERFQWSTDQSLNWGVERELLERLSLLLVAAEESLNAPPQQICWAWLGKTLFNLKGRITRGEFLLALAAMIGITASILRLTDALLPSVMHGKVLIVAVLVLIYGFICSYVKRLGDSGINIMVAFVVGIAVPMTFLVFAMLGQQRPLDARNPQSKFVDLYEVALADLFRGGYHASLATQARNFIRCIHPNLAYVVICCWGLMLYSMFA